MSMIVKYCETYAVRISDGMRDSNKKSHQLCNVPIPFDQIRYIDDLHYQEADRTTQMVRRANGELSQTIVPESSTNLKRRYILSAYIL